jgi:hypothetical protein
LTVCGDYEIFSIEWDGFGIWFRLAYYSLMLFSLCALDWDWMIGLDLW